MALIGNPLNSVAFLTDSFNGNGSTTAFTMSVAPATSSSILVVITGVTQNPTTYSVVGTTLTFSTAPPSGTANISVRYLGIPASGVTTSAYRTLTEFTATASQTTFTPPSYTVGFIAVYQNGVMLGSADYTASNGTTVVLAVGALVGDLISTESFYVSSVLNALPVTGGTISGNLVVTGTASITGVTTLTGGLNTPLAVTSGGTGSTSTTYCALATNVSGTLPVANGGTGVTTSTGSGANVLGTSPTLTTPTFDSASLVTISGTAPLYMCRAWVNFNGTGTVAINASGNVSSITDNGTGNYTVNFTTAMVDANYSVAMMGTLDVTNATYQYFCGIRASNQTPTIKTASALQLVTVQSSTSLVDSQNQSVAIFR